MLNEVGQVVLSYADEIFSAGRELLTVMKQQPGNTTHSNTSAPSCRGPRKTRWRPGLESLEIRRVPTTIGANRTQATGANRTQATIAAR